MSISDTKMITVMPNTPTAFADFRSSVAQVRFLIRDLVAFDGSASSSSILRKSSSKAKVAFSTGFRQMLRW